ncbi:MAG: AzlD domain-containing protein [Actinobacteria bacterium]|nr:AzlD domain-containing protein [Actinomycetota bacterium]
MSWTGVLAVSIIAYLTKLSGMLVPQRILNKPYFSQLALLLPTALLAALTAVQVFGDNKQLVLDARLAGLLAGAIAYKLKATFIVIVITAAITAALLRLFLGFN